LALGLVYLFAGIVPAKQGCIKSAILASGLSRLSKSKVRGSL